MGRDSKIGEMKCGRILPDLLQECAKHNCTLRSIFSIIYDRKADDSGKQSNIFKSLHFSRNFFNLSTDDAGKRRDSILKPFFTEKTIIPRKDLEDAKVHPDSFGELSYPQTFSIPSGGFPGEHRFTRQTDPCHVPSLKNAAIKCWKWPNWINCDINCLPGYALKTTKSTIKTININCRMTENVWKPQGFQDCQPYINCKAHLIKPGELKCTQSEDEPAYCEISCLDYDQFEATALQKYDCIDETFSRTLPHCAVIRDDAELIKKPK